MDKMSPDNRQIADEVLEREFRQWDDDIRALGHPKWCVTAFQVLRRLTERIVDPRRTPNRDEIRQDIVKVLSFFPTEFFDYDDKCVKEAEQALIEFKKLCEQKGIIPKQEHAE